MKMADAAEESGFWLPSEFLDDFLTDKENSDGLEPDSEFCFPTEFPYDFEPHGGAHLQKRWVMSTSPQSTLAHPGSWSGPSAGGSSNGSPNGVTSPPKTSPGKRNDAVEDLIYRAAGQVARLKLNGGDEPGPAKRTGLLGPPRFAGQFYTAARNPNPSVFHNIHLQQQRQGRGMWYSEAQMYQVRNGREIGEDAWPVQQSPTRIAGTRVLLGGSVGYDGGGAAVKRKSVGTGVFLPRRYGNNNDIDAYSDPRKRPGYSAAFVPARNSVHVLNRNVDDNMNSFVQSQPKFERGFIPNYDLLMAGRNGLVFAASPSKFTSGRLAIPSSPGVDLFI